MKFNPGSFCDAVYHRPYDFAAKITEDIKSSPYWVVVGGVSAYLNTAIGWFIRTSMIDQVSGDLDRFNPGRNVRSKVGGQDEFQADTEAWDQVSKDLWYQTKRTTHLYVHRATWGTVDREVNPLFDLPFQELHS